MIGDGDFAVFYNSDDFAVVAVLHLPGGDRSVDVIYAAPGQRSSLGSGGFIEGSEPSFTAPSVDLAGLERRHLVTVDGRDWCVEMVDPLGDGRSRVSLGVHSGQQSGTPDIRY